MKKLILALCLLATPACAKPYTVKVNPPKCETTIIEKVISADEACRKGEIGPPNRPQDGDLFSCYSAGSGGISYVNGKGQVGAYAYVPAMEHSRPGDQVRLCLVSFLADCPFGDDRGKVYTAVNLRTHGRWRKPNGSHICGGA
jgi:hypothetical protein